MENFEESFQNDLSLLHLENVPNLSTSEMSKLFHKHFLSVLNKHAPLKLDETKTLAYSWHNKINYGQKKTIQTIQKLSE